MANVKRRLPPQPCLEIPKREAQSLLRELLASQPEALERLRHAHPAFSRSAPAALAVAKFRLCDAQRVIAREYGFSNWTDLKRRIELDPQAQALEAAIRSDDCAQTVRLLREHPRLLSLPLRSGNWGPPMSHAANRGRLELVQAIAALGAPDLQHAFDRALLQGHIECAGWLHARGAVPEPGLIMNCCETLNTDGARFLAALNAPFTDAQDDPFAPVAMVLETYSRNPARKHEMLELFAARGCRLPDTPVMAFHRGDAARLGEFLRRDAALVQRRFALSEIFPPEAGCREGGLSGTPLDGSTLLHLAIDYDEQEIFDLLLANGADVNARAAVDANGFGGHTPLFNSVVSCAFLCGRQRDAGMTRALLDRGAFLDARASLRKFLDWIKEPRWHEAREVTPLQWGREFPLEGWANPEALRMLSQSD